MKNLENQSNTKYYFVLFVLITLFLTLFISNSNLNYYVKQGSYTQNIQISSEQSYTFPWMNNTNFDYPTSWISIEEGDETDVGASISDGYGNYVIYGDSGEKRIDEPLNNGEWQDCNNPLFPISPDTNGSSSAGLYITHLWNENIDQTRNTPSIYWKRTIPMGINMSDYIITDASLEVIYNASVQALDHDGGGIEVPGDYTEGEFPPGDTQLATGDFATFYVLISDIENINSYLIAINKTTNLGEDKRVITNHTDTPLDVVPKNILISYLNSVLQYNYVNFTITLGIDLYCEDNEYNADIDNWKMLIMRSFNLTFTYEKKIDKFTSISWEQTGDQISGENIQITNAVLNFDFKIDNTVFSSLSPNSEIQVFINNKQLIRSIRLSRATEILQEAYPGGIDVTSFISKDIEIAISIQLYLKDEFGLGENITISIDNIDFLITYVVYIDDIFSEPIIFQILLYVASIAGLSIGGYLLAYQRVLKYPKPVRKIRKYRRTLTRKNKPSVSIVNRKDAFMKEYKQELHKTSTYLKGKPREGVAGNKAVTQPKQPIESTKLPENNKNL